MRKGIDVLLAFAALFLASCAKSPGQYLSYVEDASNGLKKESEIGDWIYTVQYRPPVYQVCQEYEIAQLSEEEYEKALKDKAQLVLFNVSVEHKKYKQTAPLRLIAKDLAEYNKLESYFLNNAVNDFQLICGKDTIAPVVYHFEPNYGLAPHDIMIVGFPGGINEKSAKNMTLVYHDHVLRTGILRFQFDKNDLQALPELKK